MADLGAIGIKAQNIDVRTVLLDTAYAWNAVNNPVRCISFMQSRAFPKSEDWKTISGTVIDSVSAPMQRAVRAHDRATGQLLDQTTSNATTGAFTLTVPTNSEVHVISLDNDAPPLENDPLQRVIPG